ncbi:MAG: hypothetical protein HN366_10850 [Deltaproteobacteria bacterium]|jgi:hypothetical protein|nr:hypothetical protein [Deltaproteobacteria bacterium]
MAENEVKNDLTAKSSPRSIKNWPASERPREKLLHSGPESLSDGKLLAVLLRIGTSGLSAEAAQKTEQTKTDVEAMILGTKPIPNNEL